MEEQTKEEDKKEFSLLNKEAETLINKTNEAAERLEKANKRAEELLTIQTMGGKSDAGQTPKVESEEDKIKKEAMKLLEGSGLDPFKK